ncbi:MAG: LysM peptidoglycan-binding domain-containing protein, partial [Candidatus Limnocylindria bacterium]
MRHPSRVPILLVLLTILSACSSPSTAPSATGSVSVVGGTLTPSPSSSPLSSGDPIESPSAAPSADPTVAPSSGTTYTVQAGDTLAAIARAYATTSQQLQAWNSERYPTLAENPNVIEPGWTLIVSGDPNVTPRPASTLAPPTPGPTSPPSSGSGCTAGNRVAAGSAQTFRTIPNAGAGVALTFDMGGRMDPAADIMNFLVANEVCATIFATGIMSQTAQGT